MLTSVVVVFGQVEGAHGAAVARTLLLVPEFAGSAFVSAEIGLESSSRLVIGRLHFAAAAYTAAIRDRVTFWFAREGGSIRPVASMPPGDAARVDDVLARCDPADRWVSETSWGKSVRRIFSSANVEVPQSDPERPVLTLYVGGPGWAGVAYEAEARVLVIPSPLAPPVGDDLLLELDSPGCRPFVYRGVARVVASRARGSAVPGMPAGFAVAIRGDADAAHRLLSGSCPSPGVSLGTRVAPRYRVAGPVQVEQVRPTGEETIEYDSPEALRRDYVVNLSHGGAFISTPAITPWARAWISASASRTARACASGRRSCARCLVESASSSRWTRTPTRRSPLP